MSQYREYSESIFITPTQIIITTRLGANTLSTEIARDGSEDTNFAAAMIAHKNTTVSLPPTSTAPPCNVDVIGKWIKLAESDSFSTLGNVINVPAGNSGVLVLHIDQNFSGTLSYKINTGSVTAFDDLDEITVADGDILYFLIATLDEQDTASGRVEDKDTARLVDSFALLNSTITP